MRGVRCLNFPVWVWGARAALKPRRRRCSSRPCGTVRARGGFRAAPKALGTGWAAPLQGGEMEPPQQSRSTCVCFVFPSRDPLCCRLLLPGIPCSIFFRLSGLISPLASFIFSLRGLSVCDSEWETEACGFRVCHVNYVSGAVVLNYEKISPG